MAANPAKVYWLAAQRASRGTCGHEIGVGEQITFRPIDRRTECNSCSHLRAEWLRRERLRAVLREPELPGLTQN